MNYYEKKKEVILLLENLESKLISNLASRPHEIIKASTVITENDFSQTRFKDAYNAVMESVIKNRDLYSVLKERKIELSSLIKNFEYAQVDQLAREVKKFSKINKTVDLLQTSVNLLDIKSDIDSYISSVQNDLVKINSLSSNKNTDIKSLLGEFNTQREIYANKTSLLGIDTGFPKLNEMIDGIRKGHLWIIGGYCLGKGTNVVMSNGRHKKVEDVKINDRLAPVDSLTSRKVVGVTKGTDTLYKITGKYIKPFVVNSGHLIPVVKVYNGYKEEKLFKAENLFKLAHTNHYRIKKHGFFGKEKEFEIEPYYLGYWLGDGTTGKAEITCDEKDLTTIAYVKKYAERLNLRYTCRSDKRNPNILNLGIKSSNGGDRIYRKDALSLKLPKNKIIPDKYLYSSQKQRLELLAGLIDSDGYAGGAGMTNLVFCQKDINLTKQVEMLAESLGFNTTIKKTFQKSSPLVKNVDGNVLYKLTISGHVYKIPTKIPRKQIKNRTKTCGKNECTLLTFKIEKIGLGEYYGFELDGNHLFMTENYIVNHNTSTGKTNLSLNILKSVIKNKKRAVYYSLEMGEFDIISRTLAIMSGEKVRDVSKKKGLDISEAYLQVENSRLNIITDINDILKIKMSMIEQNMIEPVDVFFVDFLQIIKSIKSDNEYEVMRTVSHELQEIAKHLQIPVIALSQINNESAKSSESRMMGFKGAGDIAAASDLAIELNSAEESYEDFVRKMNRGEKVKVKCMIKKNRYGRVGSFLCLFDGETGIFEELSYAEPTVKNKIYDVKRNIKGIKNALKEIEEDNNQKVWDEII